MWEVVKDFLTNYKFNAMDMKRCIAICIAVPILFCSCHKKDDKGAGMETPAVNVAKAMEDSIVLYNDYPGYLEAKSKADVVAEVNGRLLTQNFESGSYVRKGQVLFTIDPTDYKQAVTEAEASIANAQSQRDFYAKQSAAMERAYKEDAVSQMELLQSQASLREAEASIKNARASLETARTNLGKCTVKAPISGYITLNAVSVGNYINGGASPQTLATIYDNSEFNAIFSIDDSQYNSLIGAGNNPNGALYSNMPLSFKNALSHNYTADLYYVAPSVNSSTGSLQLVGTVRNVDNELKDGMYVTVSLPYGINPKAVVVKDASLSTDQLGKYLYVVNDSDKVVYTPVTVGPVYRDSLRVITKGIKAGEKYVTEALLTVRNGMSVKPIEK